MRVVRQELIKLVDSKADPDQVDQRVQTMQHELSEQLHRCVQANEELTEVVNRKADVGHVNQCMETLTQAVSSKVDANQLEQRVQAISRELTKKLGLRANAKSDNDIGPVDFRSQRVRKLLTNMS